MPIESSSIRILHSGWNDGFTMASTDVLGPTPTKGSALPGRGLCYNNHNLTWAIDDRLIDWVYNWASQPGGLIPAAFEYVPMLWGTGSIQSWFSLAADAISAFLTIFREVTCILQHTTIYQICIDPFLWSY